jgi:hypothetical protein
MRKRLPATALLLTLAFPFGAGADPMGRTPTEDYMVFMSDALLARPIGLGATIVGATVWLVTLPFTVMARDSDVPDPFEVLVAMPARATFTRCLGCMTETTPRGDAEHAWQTP